MSLAQAVQLLVATVIPLFGGATALADSQRAELIVHLRATCTAGPHKQPSGPFAALAFCEDALGDYVALYYQDTMSDPVAAKYKKWSLDNRVWQDKLWGSDVTSFAWDPNGAHLYVGTSAVYGDGGLFDVDLIESRII